MAFYNHFHLSLSGFWRKSIKITLNPSILTAQHLKATSIIIIILSLSSLGTPLFFSLRRSGEDTSPQNNVKMPLILPYVRCGRWQLVGQATQQQTPNPPARRHKPRKHTPKAPAPYTRHVTHSFHSSPSVFLATKSTIRAGWLRFAHQCTCFPVSSSMISGFQCCLSLLSLRQVGYRVLYGFRTVKPLCSAWSLVTDTSTSAVLSLSLSLMELLPKFYFC